MKTARNWTCGVPPGRTSGSRLDRRWQEVTRCSEFRLSALRSGSSLGQQVPGGPPGKHGTRRPAPTGVPRRSDRCHNMAGATMDTDDLLKRVRAIPGVMEASILHGRQCDRLYVKVASVDAHPVNRRVHPLLEQYRSEEHTSELQSLRHL